MDEEKDERNEQNVIKIKIPSFNITGNLRRNPWMVSTVVLGVFVLVLFFGSFFNSGNSAGISGMVTATTAGNNLINFLSQNVNSTVNIDNISVESGLYRVDVEYQGSVIPLYVTLDGKYMIQTPIPLDNSAQSTASSQTTGITDFSQFTSNKNLYPSLGPDNAQTTVIEFADFQCPYCGLASGLPSWVSQYQSQYGDLINAAGNLEQMAQSGKIRFVYVPMSFLGQGSVYAAEAGLCANEQGKFWGMHDAIFTNQVPPQQEGTQFTKAQLETFAKGVSGLDTGKFNSCLESDKYLTQVQQVAQITSGIGTPMFIVNGQQVSSSWTAIQSAIGA